MARNRVFHKHPLNPGFAQIQSQYARMVYEAHVAELSKLGEMYAGLTRNAYKPAEQFAAKTGAFHRQSA